VYFIDISYQQINLTKIQWIGTVLKNGERVNIIDHRKKEQILEDARGFANY